jgi:hypothetical protein
MDWSQVIERNRLALLAVVAAIAAMIGGREGMIARRLRNAALALLRPAEAAARRLIVAASRGLSVPAEAPRPLPEGLARRRAASGDRPRAFPLFDTLKRFGPKRRPPPRFRPRIRTFWGPQPPPDPPPAPKPRPDDLVGITRFRRRLASLEAALADLPRQARRLMRLRASRRRNPALALRWPLRPGRPPGFRRNADRPIDVVLEACHGLARDALAANTS